MGFRSPPWNGIMSGLRGVVRERKRQRKRGREQDAKKQMFPASLAPCIPPQSTRPRACLTAAHVLRSTALDPALSLPSFFFGCLLVSKMCRALTRICPPGDHKGTQRTRVVASGLTPYLGKSKAVMTLQYHACVRIRQREKKNVRGFR